MSYRNSIPRRSWIFYKYCRFCALCVSYRPWTTYESWITHRQCITCTLYMPCKQRTCLANNACHTSGSLPRVKVLCTETPGPSIKTGGDRHNRPSMALTRLCNERFFLKIPILTDTASNHHQLLSEKSKTVLYWTTTQKLLSVKVQRDVVYSGQEPVWNAKPFFFV